MPIMDDAIVYFSEGDDEGITIKYGVSDDLDDVIDGVSNAGTAWSQDGTTLFYVRPDDQERPSQVWRHRVGDVTGADDTLVHDEPDERFFVAIGETRSAEWIVIHSASKTTSEVQLAPSDLSADFTIVRPRR